jgi:hypothetical protein
MSTMFDSRVISVPINREPQAVYDFASNPANLSLWASGIGNSIAQVNREWVAETEQGRVKIRFVERNNLGVLDHYVTPAAGVDIYVPMRVIPNGGGSELMFTLFRRPELTDEMFNEDAETVQRDLAALKKLLETND